MSAANDEESFNEAWSRKHNFLKRVHEVLNEYIEEGEHQDGIAFWTIYDDAHTRDHVEEYVQDFATYIHNREEGATQE